MSENQPVRKIIVKRGEYVFAAADGRELALADEPTRSEWTGTIEVHYPIRPTVHTTAKETAVSCA